MAARVAARSAEKGDNTGAAEHANKQRTLEWVGAGTVGWVSAQRNIGFLRFVSHVLARIKCILAKWKKELIF